MGYRIKGEAVRVGLMMDAQDVVECEAVADRKDRTLSEIIREAVKRYLEQERDQQKAG